LRKATRSKNK